MNNPFFGYEVVLGLILVVVVPAGFGMGMMYAMEWVGKRVGSEWIPVTILLIVVVIGIFWMGGDITKVWNSLIQHASSGG